MSGKNHNRYKLRKRMNAIKHEPVPLFDTPPTLITNWDGLVGLENDRYKLEIDIDRCYGHIVPKFEVPDNEYFDHNRYLSTHTFYGGTYFESTAVLRKFGFNIQLDNWDGETVYCKH